MQFTHSLKAPGINPSAAYAVISWFQSVAFMFSLYRYVEGVAARLGLDLDAVFTLSWAAGQAPSGSSGAPLPHVRCPATVRQALSHSLDITSQPKKSLLRVLAEVGLLTQSLTRPACLPIVYPLCCVPPRIPSSSSFSSDGLPVV
jgi:hypothetical protein